MGRGSAALRAGRATNAWATVGRDAAAAAPSAPGSIGTVRQAAIGSSASAKTRSTSPRAARPALRPRGRNSMTTAGRSPADCRSERLEERWIQRQRDAGTVARFAVRPERSTMGERREPGEREWEDPRPRSAARIRHEAHAASVVLEPRVVERSGGTSSVRWHRLPPGRWLRRRRSYGRSGSGGGTKIPIGRTPRRQDW